MATTDGGKILANAITYSGHLSADDVSNVPETSTYALTGAGCSLLGLLRRRRARA